MLCSVFVNVLVVLTIELSTISAKVFCLVSTLYHVHYLAQGNKETERLHCNILISYCLSSVS